MEEIKWVTIPEKEYKELIEAQLLLNCLEWAGVDNWHGYDYAIENYHDKLGEE